MEYGPTWKDAVERLRRIEQDDRSFVDAGLDTDRQAARAAAAELYVSFSLRLRKLPAPTGKRFKSTKYDLLWESNAYRDHPSTPTQTKGTTSLYMVTSNVLSLCHDSIIQPQIRDLTKEMLMCIYGRILELKQMLIDQDSSIYTPITKQLTNIRATYDQFELKIPRYFRDERQSFLDDIDNKIDEINKRVIEQDNNPSEMHKEKIDKEIRSIHMKTSDSRFDLSAFMHNKQHNIPQRFGEIIDKDILEGLAVELIQKHIRAASDRVAVNELLADKINRENIISGKYIPPSKEKSQAAAVKIQRYWRFYRIRRRTKIRTERRKILIGLYMSSERPNFNLQRELEYNKIRTEQNKAAIEYRRIKNKLQENLNQRNKHAIMEEIEDELRAYIWTYFETCKHFPSWPDPTPIMFTGNDILGLPPITLSNEILKELNIPNKYYMSALNQRVPLGGSAIFLTGRWMSIEMAEILATIIVQFEKKPAKERKKLRNEFAKINTIEQEKLNQFEIDLRKQNRILGVVPEPSDLTERFKNMFDDYDSNWATYNEFDEKPREDLIKTEIFAKAQLELRALVDEVIKIELEGLKMAFARDLGKKYKTPNKKSIKPVTSKIINEKKNLPNPEEIFEELVRNGMINKSVISKFDDFEGEISYSASTLRGDPYYLKSFYGLGDIRQIIKELCVIGLIFSELRTLKQIKFRSSFLIAGPEKSGRTMLTNAICTETGSLKIGLTLKNLSENYHNIKDINRLINIIVKFVRTYQPVVIEVDLADVPFYKKTPNHLKPYRPSLMKKLLLKLSKAFEKTDRVMIVGKATNPWSTVAKELTRVFETIAFTAPDYNSLFVYLNDLLMSYPAVCREFPITPLAEMLADYPRWAVAEIVSEVMTTGRVLTLRHSPLEPAEFVPAMIRHQAHRRGKLSERYHSWYRKHTPLGVNTTSKTENLIKNKIK